ncbi:MAG: hypothetical protein DWQ34_19295 [Planctomycetota bacterium]|nr:MAG: hypothetical protein DWQ34_19295 [Planctomycetota bacterium]REJ92351.1 MAG: hypothetical protein DWQ29_04900 [Planctomycetota bacterium]REK24378.1 MAG: hypothetical protein DWQ41_15265 [Planctomycetota bacterium]REK38569.1 MAG: hypothetical protein DWQ45_04060 [Planctomycetota bacterium]
MSDELQFDSDELESVPVADDDGDYEEISSEEVDRVVEALETLMATVESENIRWYLEDAIENVFHLVYSDDDETDVQSEAA